MRQKRKTNGPLTAVTVEGLLKFLFSFGMTAFGILAACYTTVSGLKLELAGKADAEAVAVLDKKINTVEVQLSERFMTKEDFYRMRDEMLELDFFFQRKFGRELAVTSVGRTEEEQRELYPEFFF